MKCLLSFIGANDGNLLSEDSEKRQLGKGSILSILEQSKFDQVHLFYAKGSKRRDGLTYGEIGTHIQMYSYENRLVPLNEINLHELELEDITDPHIVFEVLRDVLETIVTERDSEYTANTTSGTPAMHSAWLIMAESGIYPLKLVRTVMKQHAKQGKTIFEIPRMTNVVPQLQKLKTMESMVPVQNPGAIETVEDPLQLTVVQKNIARSNWHILITGETGVGKEVLASTLHESSGRTRMEILNCAGLSSELLESELFGHKKGAFTGAITDKRGIVEEVSKGTLFLDEINSISVPVQAKLLRFLESGEYRMVGSTTTKVSQARVIAASNANLSTMVSQGTFREDLYQRLRQFELNIPPLRQRSQQIPFILQRFQQGSEQPLRFADSAIERLKEYTFPGNVRELKILYNRLYVYYGGNTLIDAERVHNLILEMQPELSDFASLEIPEEVLQLDKIHELIGDILTVAVFLDNDRNYSKTAQKLGLTHPSVKKYVERLRERISGS